MTSLQFYCILGLAEIKTLHPRDKIMTMDLFQLRAHEGQKIIGEILHTMIEHKDLGQFPIQSAQILTACG